MSMRGKYQNSIPECNTALIAANSVKAGFLYFKNKRLQLQLLQNIKS